MLCLTRTPLESIQISDEITVTVLGVKGEQVRFGIKAPENMIVLREELIKRIASEGWSNSGDEATQESYMTITDKQVAPTKPGPKITYKRRISRLNPNET
jgi:carbon storage regulator